MSVLQRISERFPSVVTMLSTKRNIERAASYADVLLGAVLVPGQRSPVLVTRETVRSMKPRSIIIDISIDEGGCVETSRPTTHDHPTYVEEGVIHFCVPNMPGVVARTATHAFVNAALPYILEIATRGANQAMQENSAIDAGVVTHEGQLRQMNRAIPYPEADDGLD
jgi:alanine dehydrogenase